MKRVVIATRNLDKGTEMAEILSELLPAWDVRTLADYPPFPEPEESGSTYQENAAIKALVAAQATGELCLADDAGLEVLAMDGKPGVHSKRFAGVECSFEEKIQMILAHLEQHPREGRGARFVCAVAVASPGAEAVLFEVVKEGVIAAQPSGDGGFGYDPIFVLPDLGKSYAQLSRSEKNRVSHRRLVLEKAARWLLSNC